MGLFDRMGISRLKLAVMAPFVAFVATLAVSVSVIEFQKFQRDRSRLSLETRTVIDNGLRAAVAAETAGLRAIAEAVAANDGYRAEFRRRDRRRLVMAVSPLFDTLRRNAGVTHLYFTGPTRVNFLRVHQPGRFGDSIDRITTLTAERTRQTASGIELGPMGTLTLRVVVPWFDGNELIGYVETGKEIDHLFDGLRRQFDVHPLVFLPKGRLDRDGWLAGMQMLGRPADWDEFPDLVLAVRNGVSSALLRQFMTGAHPELTEGDHRYSWLNIDIPDAAGNTAAVVGLVLDITARHQELVRFGLILAAISLGGGLAVIALFWLVIDRVEAELLRVRRRNELLLSSAAEGILGVDVQGRCVFVNPAARDLLGLAEGEAVAGRDLHALTGHVLAGGLACPSDDCAVWRTLADGRMRRVDQDLFHRHDGTAFPVEFSVTPMAEDGGITGAVLVFHDITGRRAAEAALAEAAERAAAQAREVARINDELEQFAYVASHDLRQPLRTVSSYLGLIARQLGPNLDDDTKVCIDYAVGGAKRMDRLILDLLDYSRTGRNSGPAEPVPLDEAVADSLINLDAAMQEADASVRIEGALPTVVADRADMVRLFQNLIGNAIKYRAAGRRCEITIGSRRDGGEAVVWVRDNGVGMAPEHHARIFQIFQRLVRNDQVEGSGIGLAICKKIVGNCGGRIWVDSAEGEGSCFHVAFPLSLPSAP